MKSIEFIGAPGSGKTFFKNKMILFLKKKNIHTFNYDEFFFKNYTSIYRSNFITNKKFLLKKNLYNKNSYLLRYLNYKTDRLINFEKEYNKTNNNLYTKNFFKNYFSKLKLGENNIILRNKLKKWLISEVASINLCKKISNKKELLINSEGINQRIIRLILEIKINSIQTYLRDLNYHKFESDIVIFVNTKPSTCINRIKKRKEKKYSLSDVNNFYLKSKYIFKNTKKKKFIIDINNNNHNILENIYRHIKN